MQTFNPFLPEDVYIADGEPHVFGDRVYLFGSHDKEGGDSFCLENYEFFSAPIDDLGNWTSKGINYAADQDPLYSESAKYLYAPDVVRGNEGRFYLYYCLAGWKGRGGYSNPVSVAVCDTPDGKYEYLGVVRNPDGSPCMDFVCFDPAVINDEGVIRLYFGTGPFRNMKITSFNRFLLPRVYAGIYGKPKESFLEKPGPLGANTVELMDDMLTIKHKPVRICDTVDFEGHAFFEGSSIRKIDDYYYFVYSSEKNHELCYATSRYPDRDFKYGGTIVSNGDVGVNGRKEKDRVNITGTVHGSIECINGQWYVFYHRLTHGGDYSRQACAEKISIDADGSIKQVQLTSCGLNDGALKAKGNFPATICCNLTNRKMPHASNRKVTGIPMVTHEGSERYITDAKRGTRITYKYFDFEKEVSLTVTARGKGTIEAYVGKESAGLMDFHSEKWSKKTLALKQCCSKKALSFFVKKGCLDVLSFELRG